MKLYISEPSERHAGPILIHDEDHNDIAEFFHNEYATVGQSYETALELAQKLVTRSEPQSLWQPIETAPHDGTQILATWADSWPERPHLEAVYQHGGVWYYAYDGDCHSRPPTHWMPLLASPLSRPAPHTVPMPEKPRPADCLDHTGCLWRHVPTAPDIGLHLCSRFGCPHTTSAGSAVTRPPCGGTENGY